MHNKNFIYKYKYFVIIFYFVTCELKVRGQTVKNVFCFYFEVTMWGIFICNKSIREKTIKTAGVLLKQYHSDLWE